MSVHEWPSESVTPEKLLFLAREAAMMSYAPYSRYHVGAATPASRTNISDVTILLSFGISFAL